MCEANSKLRGFSFALSLGILLLTNPAMAHKVPPRQFLGTWHGLAIQTNNTSWSVEIEINSDGYQVDYPTLNCGGTLRLIHHSPKRLILREHISYGTETCVDKGRMVLKKFGTQNAQFRWFYPNKKLGAIGVVVRQK